MSRLFWHHNDHPDVAAGLAAVTDEMRAEAVRTMNTEWSEAEWLLWIASKQAAQRELPEMDAGDRDWIAYQHVHGLRRARIHAVAVSQEQASDYASEARFWRQRVVRREKQREEQMMRAKVTMNSMTTSSRRLPIRICYHAVPGFGKTSWAAQWPKPVFLMDSSETGLETLIDTGQLPETPHFPPAATWDEILEILMALESETHDRQTLVVDTIGGVERLCHEYVCRKEYGGDWGEKGFSGWGRGYRVALTEWRGFLASLDSLREKRKMRVILLAHSQVRTFKNPENADYDRYIPDLNEKTWGLTSRWADLILFGNYVTEVKTQPGKDKGKGSGAAARRIYTERSAAWDAKHRHGLPSLIRLGDSPKAAYLAVVEALKAGMKSPGSKPDPESEPEQDAATEQDATDESNSTTDSTTIPNQEDK